MSESRIEKARSAYLTGDSTKRKAAHTPLAISQSLRHKETHVSGFTLPEIILGGQDGLVNVLGIVLGVAAASSDPRLVVVAGLAATFAESVSMAAVAYTSKIAEADYYQSEYEREKWEIENEREGEIEEVRQIYAKYGFSGKILSDIVEKITSDKNVWLEVMMSQELKLEPVDRKTALRDGIIVGVSALIGSFIPLTPFFFLPIGIAIPVSILVSAIILFCVGYYKAKVTLGRNHIKQGTEMLVIGTVSALIGFAIGSIFKV